jgi:hypothetical protein
MPEIETVYIGNIPSKHKCNMKWDGGVQVKKDTQGLQEQINQIDPYIPNLEDE